MHFVPSNFDGIRDEIYVVIIVAIVTAIWKAAIHLINGSPLFKPGNGNRNIKGYIIGWIFWILMMPTLILFRLMPTDAFPSMIAMLATCVPMIGWLDRYQGIRKHFGGSRWFESALMSSVALPLSGLLIIILGLFYVTVLRTLAPIFS